MEEMEERRETRAKLMRAKDQKEVRALLSPKATEEEIQQVWQEIQRHRPAEGLEAVDDDELTAVSGGADRDYGAQGCASTTKDGWCGSSDKCTFWTITYDNYDPCPNGGNHDWKRKKKTVWGVTEVYNQCSKCKKEEYASNDRD